MSAVEHKHPGFFLDGDNLKAKLEQPGDNEGDDFDYDTFPFQGDEFSYALGRSIYSHHNYAPQLSSVFYRSQQPIKTTYFSLGQASS